MPGALILGSNGQDGAYLAEVLLARGQEVMGLARQPLDVNTTHRGRSKLLAQIIPDLNVYIEVIRKIFAIGIPLGVPVANDAEADTDRIDFMTHTNPAVTCLRQSR